MADDIKYETVILKEYQNYCKRKYLDFFNYLTKLCEQNIIKYKIIKKNNKKILIITSFNETYYNFNNPFIIDNFTIPNNVCFYNIIVKVNKYPKNILPNNLYIENNLYIDKLSNIEYFGKNTIVNSLYASKSNLKSIKNIKVKFNIDISGTNVTTLPNYLYLEGGLDISYTKIKKLGKHTHIQGNFLAYGSELTCFPEDLELYNYTIINGVNYIDISDTNVDIIPICYKNKHLNFIISGLFIKNIEQLYKPILHGNNFYEPYINLYIYDEEYKQIKFDNINPKLINIQELNFYIDYYHDHSILKYNKNSILTSIYKNFNKAYKNMINNYNKQKSIELTIKTILLYNDYCINLEKNPDYINYFNINKKILLEQFDRINKDELEKYIKEQNNLNKNNNEIKNTIITDFCRTEKALKFIAKNGYILSEVELKQITEYDISVFYEKVFLEQQAICENSFKINLQKK